MIRAKNDDVIKRQRGDGDIQLYIENEMYLMLARVSYIISSAVCAFIPENSQNKAEILLLTDQGLVVETVVFLLIAQGETSRQ